MVLAGTVAMEDMGFKIFGFVGGRADDWEPHLVYWGPEADMLGRERYDAEGKLENPLAATTMGLIYVNPEGPGGNPDPLAAADTVPDAQLAGGSHAPIMFTTDLALKFDPTYREISKRFLDNADEFELAFAKAWFKLTHRDMGPRALYLGDEVPEAVLLWQDPVPAVDHALIDESDIAELKQRILAFGLTTGELVRTAWASASSFRASDMRGGGNGGRRRLAP